VAIRVVTHYHRFQGWRVNSNKFSLQNFLCRQTPIDKYFSTVRTYIIMYAVNCSSTQCVQNTRGFAVHAVTLCPTLPVKERVICSSEHPRRCKRFSVNLNLFEPCSVCKQPAHRQGNRTRCSPFVQLHLTSTTTPRSHGSRRQAYMLI
jgi:hypothetical protein